MKPQDALDWCIDYAIEGINIATHKFSESVELVQQMAHDELNKLRNQNELFKEAAEKWAESHVERLHQESEETTYNPELVGRVYWYCHECEQESSTELESSLIHASTCKVAKILEQVGQFNE